MAAAAQSTQVPAPGGTVADAAATIHLKTSMLVPELHDERLALTEAVGTMEALVREIGRRCRVNLFDARGELIDFLDVRLNDKNIAFHPAGLATRLKHGDRVLIRLVPIGGG